MQLFAGTDADDLVASVGIDGDGNTGATTIAFDAARERMTAGAENSVWTRGDFRAAMDFGELTFGSGELILADGTLRNHSREVVEARVEIQLAARRQTEPGADWEQMWSPLVIEDRLVRVPASAGKGPGLLHLLEPDLARRVPDRGLVRLVLHRPMGDQFEEFVAHVLPVETEAD